MAEIIVFQGRGTLPPQTAQLYDPKLVDALKELGLEPAPRDPLEAGILARADKLIATARVYRLTLGEKTRARSRAMIRAFSQGRREFGHAALPERDEDLAEAVHAMLLEAADMGAKPSRILGFGSDLGRLLEALNIASTATKLARKLVRRAAARRARERSEEDDLPREGRRLAREEVRALIAAAETGTRLRAAQEAAYLRLSLSLMARREEMVALDIDDVSFTQDGAAITGAKVRIRRSKTDQSGRGAQIGVDRATAQALRAWIDLARRTANARDPLFVAISPHGTSLLRQASGPDKGRPRRLSAKAAEGLVLRAGKAAGLGQVLPHDLRRTGARLLWEAGETLEAIMARGRWKTPQMARNYIGSSVAAGADALAF
jgi:integrase